MGIAQLVRVSGCGPEGEGSSPFTHPEVIKGPTRPFFVRVVRCSTLTWPERDERPGLLPGTPDGKRGVTRTHNQEN